MKLADVDNEVLTNSNRESKFTINASAQAFKILSDGLYQYKIAAIVRELSFNAYDSHVQADKLDTPFRVILPNTLHQYFEIEDFGVGLDDEGVREVYTSYFTSTKNDSNDAVGAFGLGSKTPFSYTTSFNIRARMNGVERQYTAYLGSDGAPCVNMLYEKPTSECNGVKISMPVKDRDIKEFHDEANFILSFFKVRPDVNADIEYYMSEEDLEKMDRSGYVQVEKITTSNLYSGHRVYAVMGGVCYPISSELMTKDWSMIIGRGGFYDNKKTFVKFDIGQLQVAASRENLSLDEGTIDFVKEEMNNKLEEILADDQRHIDSLTHLSKVIRYINQRYTIHSNIFKFKGEPINVHKEVCLDAYDGYFLNTRTGRGRVIDRRTEVTLERLSSYKTIKAVYYRPGDKASRIVTESRQLTDYKTGVFFFKTPMTDHKMNRIEQLTGCDVEWVELSSLKQNSKTVKPVKVNKVKRDSTEIYARQIRNYMDNKTPYLRQVDWIDLKDFDGVYYIETSELYDKTLGMGSYWFRLNGVASTSITQDDLEYILSLMYPDKKTVCVVINTARSSKKISENNVRHLSELIEQFEKDWKDELVSDNLKSMFYSDGDLKTPRLLRLVDKAGSTFFKQRMDELREKYFHNRNPVIESASARFSVGRYIPELTRSETSKQMEMIDDLDSKVVDLYPMLKFAPYDTSDDTIEAVSHYVKMVDQFRNDVNN